MRKTTNYGLSLYDKEDNMTITAEENSLNANTQIIDEVLKEKATIQDMTDYIEEHKEELKGETGPQGIQGEQGIQGIQGPKGEDGKDGYTPVKGIDYFDGKDGINGIDGKDGEQGPKGDKGDIGEQGPAGKDGVNGKDGVSATHSWNGTTLTVTSASGTTSANLKGDKGDKGDSYVMTEADKAEITQMVIESLGGNPVFGYVDKDNNIIVSGNIPDGDYTVSYEMENGELINIGNLVLDNTVEYTITKNLTNCSISNNITEVVAGESYSATISANSGYELKSVSVTMGGSAVSVSGGNINIGNVTGNIIITAIAEEEIIIPTYTNQIPISRDINGDYLVGDNGEKGYKTNTRLSISAGGETTSGAEGCEVTGYIEAAAGDILRIKNITTGSDGKNVLLYFDINKAKKDSGYTADIFSTDEGNGVYSGTLRNVVGTKYIRIGSENIDETSILTINEEIV